MFLFILFLLPLIHGARAECRPEYRKIPGKVTHTACKPLPSKASCQKVASGISAVEKKVILELHNKLRSKVASGQLPGYPTATNMYQLEWDDELAEVAQAHADLCNFAHDNVNERFTTQFRLTGQNIATSSSSEANDTSDWSTMISKWFDENKDTPVSVMRSFRQTQGPPIGHFTEVVWAKTRFVGCGYNSYASNRGHAYRKLYTCNYANAGNVLNHAVYKEGQPCSQCMSGAKCDEGLCNMTGLPIGGEPGARNCEGRGGSPGRGKVGQPNRRRPSTDCKRRRGGSNRGSKGRSGDEQVVNGGKGANGHGEVVNGGRPETNGGGQEGGRTKSGGANGKTTFYRSLRFGGFRTE